MTTRLIKLFLVIVLVTLACATPPIFDPNYNPNATATENSPGQPDVPTLPPVPTPTATPLPEARIEEGDEALFYGDYERALREYQFALDNAAGAEEQAIALLGLGRTQFEQGNYGLALDLLGQLVNNFPESQHRASAFFLMGMTYDALDRYAEAAPAYQQYLDLRPGILDAYAQERRGDTLVAAGLYGDALIAYQGALNTGGIRDPLNTTVKIGNTYALAGDFNAAAAAYQDVYNRTGNDFVKAQMALYLGQAYTALGLTDAANTAYLDAVENYPLSYDSYTALVELVNAEVPVSELDRGLVDYFAGQYTVAIAAFDRYLEANPEHADTAHYYKGLSLLNLGDAAGAIAEFDEQINTHPFGDLWANAYDEKGFAQWVYLGQPAAAAQTYLEFVALNPGHGAAPDYLFIAGRMTERSGDLAGAADIWDRIFIEYPASEWAYEGLFQAGIVHYRLGNYVNALSSFQDAVAFAPDLYLQAQSQFWIGKTHQTLGDGDASQQAWVLASAIDPTGYYSERSRDLLNGRSGFLLPANYDLTFDAEAEKIIAEDWLRTTFNLPPETDLNGPGPLAGDGRLIRGTELWNLGLFDDARIEFESLRQEVAFDAANSYRLANYMIDLGLYRPGITAARQVLNLAGLDDAGTLTAPAYFNHLRFGVYFEELILPTASENNIHPLILLSVMRQESLFEGFARSSAGARGLMQIIPSTGASVAARMNWPLNYTDEDLYRPQVSVRLGGNYLASQAEFFGGDMYVALAAYNGGPGNADAWNTLAGGDQDLFLEIVRFAETRNYIRGIYEIYTIYRNIYGMDGG
ncbi:MAG: hypothetical protein DWQ07_03545 [Chloroflexi bacterium]|nr:MAG: hypothetical protein DWQ07_03545 [Chloroflexota bacterium]MBL1193424.1 hypothetical protein [Chloroflexota bacterium]NOH10716.1 tetratricopeptide repeat protein [Chloroflexota bacterium]